MRGSGENRVARFTSSLEGPRRAGVLHKELLERYVERMNAVNHDIPLVHQMQKLLAKEAEALHAEYLAEREKQALPPEVGWMSS
jgi:hypothetical protein